MIEEYNIQVKRADYEKIQESDRYKTEKWRVDKARHNAYGILRWNKNREFYTPMFPKKNDLSSFVYKYVWGKIER